MAKAISQLPDIAQADFTDDDCFVVVDTSDTEAAPTGTTKKITRAQAFTNLLVHTALVFYDAVSKVIPGSTSFAIRNHADSADNLLVSDTGDVTVRNALKLAPDASQIVPGATSLAVRDHADANDNLLVEDDGDVTVRGAMSADEVRSSNLFTDSGDGWSVKNHDGSLTYLQASTSGALTTAGRVGAGGLVSVTGDAAGHFFLDSISAPAAPANGAIWFDGSDLFIRVSGITYKLNKTSV
jgi:hypothetical protein